MWSGCRREVNGGHVCHVSKEKLRCQAPLAVQTLRRGLIGSNCIWRCEKHKQHSTNFQWDADFSSAYALALLSEIDWLIDGLIVWLMPVIPQAGQRICSDPNFHHVVLPFYAHANPTMSLTAYVAFYVCTPAGGYCARTLTAHHRHRRMELIFESRSFRVRGEIGGAQCSLHCVLYESLWGELALGSGESAARTRGHGFHAAWTRWWGGLLLRSERRCEERWQSVRPILLPGVVMADSVMARGSPVRAAELVHPGIRRLAHVGRVCRVDISLKC